MGSLAQKRVQVWVHGFLGDNGAPWPMGRALALGASTHHGDSGRESPGGLWEDGSALEGSDDDGGR